MNRRSTEDTKRELLNALREPKSYRDLKYLFLNKYVYHVLKELVEEGLVVKERRGVRVYYRSGESKAGGRRRTSQ